MDKFFEISALNLPGAFVLTCLMSLLAIILALVFRTTDRTLCVFAMLLSSVGDILLMNFRGLNKLIPDNFFVGAGFFIAAHIIYMLAFGSLIKNGGYKFFNAGAFAGIALIVVVFVFFTYLTFKNEKFDAKMYIMFVLYLLIIGANCCTIFSYSVSAFKARPAAILAAIGALSFFLSDCFIGMNSLAGISGFGKYIWWFYPIGQLLILIAG